MDVQALKNRSTVTALLDVTDNILAAQDTGMCTLLVLLDFSRAFDSIDTSLLLSKLTFYGFNRATVNWFNSYLTNRTQMVELNLPNGSTVHSTPRNVNRGVPQGSVLGPILFTLHSCDITKSLLHCQYHIYADDLQLYISFKPQNYDNTINVMNEELVRIVDWSRRNSLILNPNKTKYMLFGTKHQLSHLPSINKQVMVMDEPIERVSEARNLGLVMDTELRFETHIAACVRNCFYRLKVLYKMRPFLSEELRLQLVESLVLSKLNYADIVYGPRLFARTSRLIQRVQNACSRFCFTIAPRSRVTPTINKHLLLKMKARRKLHLACLLFGVMQFGTPPYLYNKIKWVGSNRTSERRFKSIQLVTPRHCTAAFRGSFRYNASKCWNNIPPPIRSASSLSSFKNKLRNYLLESQACFENCNQDISAI